MPERSAGALQLRDRTLPWSGGVPPPAKRRQTCTSSLQQWAVAAIYPFDRSPDISSYPLSRPSGLLVLGLPGTGDKQLRPVN